MEWRSGDMIDVCREVQADGVVFSANSTLRKSGELVMGAGAAKRVRDTFTKNLGTCLGEQILQKEGARVQPDYYLAGSIFKWEGRPFYVFALQVKRDFKFSGDLTLTIKSLVRLAGWCKRHPDVQLVMNCPLIGLGGFGHNVEEVKQVVEDTLKNTSVIVTIL